MSLLGLALDDGGVVVDVATKDAEESAVGGAGGGGRAAAAVLCARPPLLSSTSPVVCEIYFMSNHMVTFRFVFGLPFFSCLKMRSVVKQMHREV